MDLSWVLGYGDWRLGNITGRLDLSWVLGNSEKGEWMLCRWEMAYMYVIALIRGIRYLTIRSEDITDRIDLSLQ